MPSSKICGRIIVPFEITDTKNFKQHLKAQWKQETATLSEARSFYSHSIADLNDCKYYKHEPVTTPENFLGQLNSVQLRIYRSKLAFLVLNFCCTYTDDEKKDEKTKAKILDFYKQLASLQEDNPIVAYVQKLLCTENQKDTIRLCPNTNQLHFYSYNFFDNMSFLQKDGFKQISGSEKLPELQKQDISVYLSQYNLSIACELTSAPEHMMDEFGTAYLIAIIKQQSLLKIYHEMNDLTHNHSTASSMKKELLEYIGKKQYPILSEDEFLDKVYSQLLQTLKVNVMESTLKQQLFTINDELTKRNSASTSRYLFVIGLFGIINILYDGLSIDKMLSTATPENPIFIGSVTIIAIVLCLIGIGFLILAPIYRLIRNYIEKKWEL